MGRHKKNLQEKDSSFSGLFNFSLASDAKRSIIAIALTVLAFFVALAFFGKAGILGEKVDYVIGLSIGWSRFVLPIFLILLAAAFLFRREAEFYLTKTLGIVLAFVSLTGIFHWFFSMETMKAAAQKGMGGGYLGYLLAETGGRYLGVAGAFIVFWAIFVIGLIITFEVSIFELIKRLYEAKKRSKTSENIDKPSLSASTQNEPLASNKEAKSEDNIAKVEFVEENESESSLLGRISDNFSSKRREKSSIKPARHRQKISAWQLPPLDLLEESNGLAKGGDIERNAEIIEKTLRNFGIDVERGEIKVGPSVTQYSFRPAVGVKISKILSLQNDLALALAAHPVRIEAPIPGKSLIGIEVPNKVAAIVGLKNILSGREFQERHSNLTLAIGEDVAGNFIFGDLGKMPHLMIAGATGTGKSVGINSIITALLYQNSPEDLKLIMVDPKRVELSLYKGIPHLLCDVIVDNHKVINALRWAVSEMERRYKLLQEMSSRDIISFNDKVESGQRRKVTNPETGEVSEEDVDHLPYIVIVIDEVADLMGSHGKEVEGSIVRLAQMARAVGIHLIVSTQRPSVEVITGLIKANITTRIAFQVATQIDSRTILDMSGAEKLLGNGDMLFISTGAAKPKRVQGAFVSESEVKRVVKFVIEQKHEHGESLGEEITGSVKASNNMSLGNSVTEDDEGQGDDMYQAAKEEVLRAGKASASLLQRRLRVGYARAARLLDILEANNIIGPADGAKPREVFGAKNHDNNSTEGIDYENPTEDQVQRDKWQF